MGKCAAGWGSGWGYLRVGDEARAKGGGGHQTRDRTERAHPQSRTIAHHRQTPRNGGPKRRSPKTTSATRPTVHFLWCLWRVQRRGSRQNMWHVAGTWLVRGWHVARPDRHSRGAWRQRPRAAGRFQRRRLGARRARRGWRASPCSSRATPRARVGQCGARSDISGSNFEV